MSARRTGTALLVGVATVALGCGGSGQRAPHSRPPGDRLEALFEAEAQLHADPIGTLKLLARFGLDRVRVYVAWTSLAPTPSARTRPAGFNGADPRSYAPGAWSGLDQIVRAAAAQRIGLDLTLGGPPPLWAAGPGAPRGGPFAQWMPSASEFGNFVRAVGTRYSGRYEGLPRVAFWSIWNEPNYGPDLAPQAIRQSTVEVSPRLYRGLLDAAWSALHASGHGSDTILFGETAPRGLTVGNSPGNFSGMVPLRFLRALYCLDRSLRPLRGAAASDRGCRVDSVTFRRSHPALFEAAGFAAHLYPQGGLPPDAKIPDEPDYADLASLPELEKTLDAGQRAYGSSRQLPIYDTEFGYQTNPPEKISRTVDPATAARYINWAEYIHWRDQRVRSYAQYLLSDPPTANATGGFATGLQFKNGAPKPSLQAFRMPIFLPLTTAGAGHPLELWGCVRPAARARQQTGRRQRVAIEFAASGSRFRPLKTLTISDPGGYFDTQIALDRSGTVRLSWSYPNGPTIHSRAVAVIAR